MNARDAMRRRLLALHNAELKGRAAFHQGVSREAHPYRGKKLRGATVELYRSWVRGWDEARQDNSQGKPLIEIL